MRPLLLAAALAAHALWLPECATAQSAPARPALQAFRDTAELAAFHRRIQEERERRLARIPPPTASELMNSAHTIYPPPPAPEPPPGTPMQHQVRHVVKDREYEFHAAGGGDERATAGVRGDIVVVLRRGRLFTVRTGGDTLQAVSAVDAFGPHVDPLAAIHDELLVDGRQVVVIGSNHRLNGTELGFFDLAPDGRLTHRATYHLKTEDNFSPHPYAARLQDGRLVFYAPLQFHQPPVLYRWGMDSSTVHHTTPADRIYRPAAGIPDDRPLVLHVLLTCGLAGGEPACESSAVYAPRARAFHLSPSAVYLWTDLPRMETDPGPRSAVLHRIPLDRSAPTALRVTGVPADPFSFLEGGDGRLHVLTEGAVLLSVPLAALGDGSQAADSAWYRALPPATGEIRSSYVGDWLLYGSSEHPGNLHAVRWADGRASPPVALTHPAEHIEAMGLGAAVAGADGDALHVTTLRLGPESVVRADSHSIAGTAYGYGLFYHPQGEDAGVLALPVTGPRRPADAPRLLGPAGLRLLRQDGGRLHDLGELAASAAVPAEDHCLYVTCGLWYAGTRPLFASGRVMALLGYELVEGREAGGRMGEVRRVGFTPTAPGEAIGGDWTFHESIGAYRTRYYCHSRGTMWLDRAGAALSMRYRQNAQCTIDGAETREAGEGSGTGTVHPTELVLEVGACRYTGRMRSAHYIDGDITCRVPLPDGSEMDAKGHWSAWRPQP